MNLIHRLWEWGWGLGVTKDSSQLPVHYLIDYWKIAPTPFLSPKHKCIWYSATWQQVRWLNPKSNALWKKIVIFKDRCNTRLFLISNYAFQKRCIFFQLILLKPRNYFFWKWSSEFSSNFSSKKTEVWNWSTNTFWKRSKEISWNVATLIIYLIREIEYWS